MLLSHPERRYSLFFQNSFSLMLSRLWIEILHQNRERSYGPIVGISVFRFSPLADIRLRASCSQIVNAGSGQPRLPLSFAIRGPLNPLVN